MFICRNIAENILNAQVLNDLKHYAETWVGMELDPYIAYGFRLYREGSHLNMHVDRSQTHVISFILHIDSSEDAEPWPIVIEDFHGRKCANPHVRSGRKLSVALVCPLHISRCFSYV